MKEGRKEGRKLKEIEGRTDGRKEGSGRKKKKGDEIDEGSRRKLKEVEGY